MFVFAFMAAELGFPYLFVLVVVSVLLNWVASICISVKRLHDCNVSGWWWLLLMWFSWISIIVLGCIKGTEGPNRYGPATTPTLASEVDKARKERIDSTVRRLQETSDDDRHQSLTTRPPSTCDLPSKSLSFLFSAFVGFAMTAWSRLGTMCHSCYSPQSSLARSSTANK